MFNKTEYLINLINKSIELNVRQFESLNGFFSTTNVELKFAESEELNNLNIFNDLMIILEYQMLLNIIMLDAAASFKAFLTFQSNYEKSFGLRKLKLTIYEGYKQIFHFVILNENGHEIKKERNKSYWVKDIGPIIKRNASALLNDYERISIELENFYDTNSKSLLDSRNLLTHYDKKSSLVYKEILKINQEQVIKEMLDFMDLKSKMNILMNNVVNHISKKIKKEL